MSSPRLEPGVLLAVLMLAACGGGKGSTLSASSYDRACQSSGECTPIFEGHVASCQAKLECPNAAINSSQLDAYRHDLGELNAPCTEDILPAASRLCPGGKLTCPTGQCEFHPGGLEEADAGAARAVAAADYGQTCETVADCVAVYVGPLGCCDQGCPNASIRADALAQYMSDVEHRAPICYPIPPCAPPDMCTNGRVACENGLCVLLTTTQ